MSLHRHAYRGMAPMRRLLRLLKVEENGCLTYTGALNDEGYATAWLDGKSGKLHRWMYEQIVGPIPAGLTLDHLCQTRHCCNPAHLEPVTSAENTRRAAERRTACRYGHPYSPENTYWFRGTKNCRTCAARRLANFHDRNSGTKETI